MTRGRHLTALALCGLAGLTFLGWLLPALLGARPRLLPQVELGHWSNVRLVAWLLLSAALLAPRREAWLVPLEKALEGRGRWLFPSALTLFAVAYKVLQHVSFYTTALDLTMYHSAVRNVWADAPSFMWAWGLERSFFSEHFSPILLAFVPLDLIFRSPLVLLIVEGALFGLGALTIAGAMRSLGLRPLFAQCVALAYATNSRCWDALHIDFHPESLLPFALFATVWALNEKRAGWLVVSVVTALSLKEDVVVTLLPMVGLVWLDRRRSWRWPLAVVAASLLWFVVALKVVMPLAQPPGTPWSLFAERYGHWGSTPGAALVAMVSRPAEVLSSLVQVPVTRELRQLAWVPLLDPLGVLASVPALLEQRLSRQEAQQQLALYYGIGVVAVWLLALGRGTRWVERRFGFTAALLVATAPLLYHPHARGLPVTSWQDVEDDQLLLEHLPPGVDVVAQTNVVPHLPIGPNVRLFPGEAEFVALRPATIRWPASDAEYRAAVIRLLDDEGFGVVVRSPTLVILRRGAPREENDAVKAMLPTSER